MCSSCKLYSERFPWLGGQNRKTISVCRCCRKHLCDFCARHHRWDRMKWRRRIFSIKNNLSAITTTDYPSKVYGRPSINNRRLK